MSKIRIGHGYDVHALKPNRKLILLGEEVPFELGLLGHSDADVATHAVMDAILGALGKGDIGHLFPDSDDAYLGISSIVLLDRVMELLWSSNYQIGNVDVTIIAQKPKLSPYIENMKHNLAKHLNVDVSCVNVKATTEEHLGFTGRLEGISSHAVCLIEKKDI